jgi:hypothetical protein
MRNAVAVEFAQVGDARPGGEDSFAGPHVGIHGRWDFLTNNSERRRGDPETDQVPNFKDGQLHHALVRYVPNELHPELGRLSVYVDNFETPVLETDMDLAFRIPLEDGRAFVGFTASSDSATNHDLIRWSFTSIH